MYCPPEVTATTRPSGLCGESRPQVASRTNGPSTIVAKVRSNPSAVSSRVANIAPALSTKHVDPRRRRRGSRSAAARTEASDAMSATTDRTAPSASRPRARSASARVVSRRARRAPASAPIRAKDPAASRPSPDVGPVITTVRPGHRPGLGVPPIEQSAPDSIAHPREGRDDEDLEQVVEQGSEIGHVHMFGPGTRPDRSLLRMDGQTVPKPDRETHHR